MIDHSSRIASLHKEMLDIITSLAHIEVHNRETNPQKAFTAFDVIDVLNMTKLVIVERINDGTDDWQGDDSDRKNKMAYTTFFTSVKEQIKDMVVSYCGNQTGKIHSQFVNTYNTLFVDRLIQMMVLFGPSSAVDLVGPIVDQFVNTISDVESDDPLELSKAQEKLTQYRRDLKKKVVMSHEDRLDLIASLFDKLQEAA